MSSETLIESDVAAVLAVRSDAPDTKGAPGAAFKAAAAADAAARAGEHYGCAATMVDALNFDEVLAAAQAAGAEQIVTPYAPVGVTALALNAMDTKLADAGIPLVRPRRAWDDRFWPHATKGYFAFKQKLPQLLATG